MLQSFPILRFKLSIVIGILTKITQCWKLFFKIKKKTITIGISHKNCCLNMIHTSNTRKPKCFKPPSNPQVKGYSQSSLGSVVMPPAMRKMYERVFPKLVDLCVVVPTIFTLIIFFTSGMGRSRLCGSSCRKWVSNAHWASVG